MRCPAGWHLTLCIMLVSLWTQLLFGQSGGLPQEWELREQLDSLEKQTNSVRVLMEEVKPDAWIATDAAGEYGNQLRMILEQIGFASRSTSALAARPERLAPALETLFRLQSADEMIRSLDEGIRRYQSGELADRIRVAQSRTSSEMEKLRQYIVQLAVAQEGQLSVMSEEAQRCRGVLSRQPPARGEAAKKPEKK